MPYTYNTPSSIGTPTGGTTPPHVPHVVFPPINPISRAASQSIMDDVRDKPVEQKKRTAVSVTEIDGSSSTFGGPNSGITAPPSIVIDPSSQQIRSSKSPKRGDGDVTANLLDETSRRLAQSVADAEKSAASGFAGARSPTQVGGATGSGGVGPLSSAVATQGSFDLAAADGSNSQLVLMQRKILQDH